jgi:hypothetical protein
MPQLLSHPAALRSACPETNVSQSFWWLYVGEMLFQHAVECWAAHHVVDVGLGFVYDKPLLGKMSGKNHFAPCTAPNHNNALTVLQVFFQNLRNQSLQGSI